MHRWFTLATLFFAASATASALTREDIEAAISAPSFEVAFKPFLGKLPQVVVAEQGNAIYYIVEGDILLDEEGVQSYLMSLRRGQVPARDGELLVLTEQGKKVIWPKGQRQLTYAVDRESFPSRAQYQVVVDNMRAAAEDWMFCQECAISFVHKPTLDPKPKTGQVTFIVRYSANVDGAFAVGFFPNATQVLRYVHITPAYFTTDYDRVGILRHELGHVLGYQHEQAVGVPGCAREGNNWQEVSPYNPRSVMHYLCGGGGTKSLVLQNTDKAGHRATYAE
ncbi:zinc metalloprotease [Pseudomonas sp. RT6P73]